MNSVAIGSVIGSETHINKEGVAARILPGFFTAISPGKAQRCPQAPGWVLHSRNKCIWHKTNHTHRDSTHCMSKKQRDRDRKKPF